MDTETTPEVETATPDPGNTVPVNLFVPESHWRKVAGYLVEGPNAEPVLVIEGQTGSPADKFNGHPLWCLDLGIDHIGAPDPDRLLDRWKDACKAHPVAVTDLAVSEEVAS